MRVLLVTSHERDEERLRRPLLADGHEVATPILPVDVMAAVRQERPDALVVGPAEPDVLRLVVQRAREAAERELPAILVVPDGSIWLRGSIPADLVSAAIVVASGDAGHALVGALTGLQAERLAIAPLDARAEARVGPAGARALRYDADKRSVEGPDGFVALTPSEAIVLRALIEADRGVVEATRLTSALWGRPLSDRHSRAAIRTHVYTLRRKLRLAGLDGILQSLPGVGYRLDIDRGGDRDVEAGS